MRIAVLLATILIAGCGVETAPQTDMSARSWKYYVAQPGEIESMQKICREWSGSSVPAASQPAVMTTNCRAAAFAKSQLQLTKQAQP